MILTFFFLKIVNYSSEGKEELSIASQKNRLLAIVLIMNGCPQAALRDGEGRSVFIEALKKSLASDNVEVIAFCNNRIHTFSYYYFIYIVGYYCSSMSS